MSTQRIVTGHDDQGRSCIISAGSIAGDTSFKYQPGFSAAVFWQTDKKPKVGAVEHDVSPSISAVLPRVAGTTALIVTFPPSSSNEVNADITPDLIAKEIEEKMPGFAQVFEPDAPGFHRTDTIDYAVLIEGELTLVLDDNQRAQIKAGDVVVQNGTRHAWLNTGECSARVMFVMVGAIRE